MNNDEHLGPVMLRDPSLVPLSHQHQHGLALVVMLTRSLDADSSQEAVAEAARRIVDRYEVELVNHFDVEERILFPSYDRELTRELIGEHREMERQVAVLRTEPTPERVRDFLELLRGHIRREENELFAQIQQSLPRQTLDDLGTRIEESVIKVCL